MDSMLLCSDKIQLFFGGVTNIFWDPSMEDGSFSILLLGKESQSHTMSYGLKVSGLGATIQYEYL